MLAGESLKLKLDAPARDNGEVEPGEDNGDVDKLEPRDAEARRGELAEIRKREGSMLDFVSLKDLEIFVFEVVLQKGK